MQYGTHCDPSLFVAVAETDAEAAVDSVDGRPRPVGMDRAFMPTSRRSLARLVPSQRASEKYERQQ
jgi:hypothetical protein